MEKAQANRDSPKRAAPFVVAIDAVDADVVMVT
jgi:hypothetical protein